MQVALGSALTATKGFSAAEMVEPLARARALAEQLDRPEYLVPLLHNQAGLHLARGEYRRAMPLCQQLEQLGKARNDVTAQILGCRYQGIARFWLGELAAARAVLERGVGLVGPAYHPIETVSVDPYPQMLGYLGVILVLQGHLDQARSRRNEAVTAARRFSHVHTLATVLGLAGWFDWLTDSPFEHAEELLALVTEHRFQFWWGRALVYRGKSLLALGRAQDAVALITQGLAKLHAAEAFLGMPVVLTWLAQAHAALGQMAEVEKCLAEAAKRVEASDERFVEAEVLHRVPGDLRKAAGDPSGAERHYQQAIAIAERQGARLLQLRACTRLARLWRDQGRRAEAHDLLASIYGWFTEGFDVPVLKEAKALLEELA
ncbi:MAG: hypothetical protein JOZ11_17585 [Alphaproteobacteria bacterium]|nr:hypothetical protein [Alphaproteobacteria bacterium]